MMKQHTYFSPDLRVVPVLLDAAFCASDHQEGSVHGGLEDVGYDNWLDGLE